MAGRLIANARPLAHYLRFFEQLREKSQRHWTEPDLQLVQWIDANFGPATAPWLVLRLMDVVQDGGIPMPSRYFSNEVMDPLVEAGLVERTGTDIGGNGFAVKEDVSAAWQSFVNQTYVRLTPAAIDDHLCHPIPRLLSTNGVLYAAKN